MSGFQHLFRLTSDLFTGPVGFGTGVWVLAGVFAWSGIAKWRQPLLAALAMSEFGVTQKPRRAYGVALGFGEGLLSCALIAATVVEFREIRGLVLAAAALLLWFFVILIARSLRQGRTFACLCFGDGESKLSGKMLLRTAALAVLASTLLVAVLGRPDPVSGARVVLLQAESAAALLGTFALVAQFPRLTRWGQSSLSRRGVS